MDGTPRISLALAIHNHQPIGNFGWVLESVFDHAYRPLVDLLERHPRVRLSLHYSGPLLQWLQAERPAFVDSVLGLVARGQVELIGGGWYEPVLASLPDRDRSAQLNRMSDELERMTGRRPAGAWLAERVWEPSLPTSLVDAGHAWTIVDDAHLRAASIPNEEHWAPYTTDDQGRRLTVFGTEQGLRYLIPFRDVEEVIEHLRAHATPAGDRLGTMGDDGEKFGAWPTTFEHCWGHGQWMERFFDALEANADWLTTVTPTDWLALHPPAGRVYIPTSSYTEMTEWVLPPADSIEFGQLLQRAIDDGRPEARYLRGGFWRNFERRYREINDLHKQMLRASADVDALAPGATRDRALDHLLMGQSNDCYWHGLFGGVYITHMRLATFEHLIAAEDIARRQGGDEQPAGARLADLDLDGIEEALIETSGQVVAVKLDQGAGIGQWDIRAVRHALTAVLRRRPEASHARLIAATQSGQLQITEAPHDPVPTDSSVVGAVAAQSDTSPEREQLPEAAAVVDALVDARVDADAGADADADHVESIHEIVAAREPGLVELLVYDTYERRSGLVHLLDPKVTPDDFIHARFRQLGDFVDGPFELIELAPNRLVAARDGWFAGSDGPQAVRIVKTITLDGDRRAPGLGLDVRIENRSERTIDARLGIEWSLVLLGGGGNPSAFYEIAGERHTHDSTGRTSEPVIRSGNEWIGIALATSAVPAAYTWWAPIDTISNSEAGFERTYQGSSMLQTWPLHLEPGATWQVEVRQAVTTTRDRTAEEDAAAAGTAG
jgi:alpha-amylase